MKARTPVAPDLLAAAARLSGIDPSPERLAQLVPAMNDFYGLLDALHRGELGETPPAIAFRAKWGER
jgi:hypothetical protein